MLHNGNVMENKRKTMESCLQSGNMHDQQKEMHLLRLLHPASRLSDIIHSTQHASDEALDALIKVFLLICHRTVV